jgi:hypothetical protein
MAVVLLGMLFHVKPAWAGMPSAQLSDLAKLRLDAISFFLVVLLLCSGGVKGIWNSFTKDFPKLPRLSFWRAFGLVTLWGLLFIIVLTMISGARELMTPGAWQKDGFTYSLQKSSDSRLANGEALVSRDQRKSKLERLWTELIRHAARNDGRFPSKRDAEAIPDEHWQLPDAPSSRYVYLDGRTAKSDSLLAFEPSLFDDGQLGLLTNGEVRLVTPDEIRKAISTEPQP